MGRHCKRDGHQTRIRRVSSIEGQIQNKKKTREIPKTKVVEMATVTATVTVMATAKARRNRSIQFDLCRI